jgi:hypothetical protein
MTEQIANLAQRNPAFHESRGVLAGKIVSVTRLDVERVPGRAITDESMATNHTAAVELGRARKRSLRGTA